MTEPKEPTKPKAPPKPPGNHPKEIPGAWLSDPNRPFYWTARKEKAAELIASGRFRVGVIAKHVGVQTQALLLWRKNPEFQARVAEEAAKLRAELLPTGIANKAQRIEAAQERWLALQQIIERRAQAAQEYAGVDAEGVDAKGDAAEDDDGEPAGQIVGASGNVIQLRPAGNQAAGGRPGGRQPVGQSTAGLFGTAGIAAGEETGLIIRKRVPGPGGGVDFTVDTDILREMRELEKQIAQEMGQWQQKVDVTTGDKPITFTIPMNDSDPVIIEGDAIQSLTAGAADGETIVDADS